MHCKTCDYPLWGVTSRACPECGTTFRPSEFEFAPNAVRFACPHCATAYFGTSAQGHLVPESFECVHCHRAITMDEMIVTPVGGVTEGSEALPRNIWIARGESPLLPTWWATTKQLLFNPRTFARSLPRHARAKDAWTYAFVSFAIHAAIAIVLGVAFLLAGESFDSPWLDMLPTSGNAFSIVGQVAGLIASNLLAAFIITPLAIILTSLLVHLVVMLIAKKRSTLSSTLQTQLYGFGAVSLFSAAGEVPSPGGGVVALITIVWFIVISSHLVSRVHRTSGFGGFVATMAPTACCCVVFVGAMGVVWYSFASVGVPLGGGPRINRSTSVVPTLVAARDNVVGGVVADPFTLALGDTAMLQEVIDAVTFDTPEAAIGGVRVADLIDVPIERRDAAIAALAARIPKGDVPFRVGSATFYYRSDTDGPEGFNGWLVVTMLRDGFGLHVVLTESGQLTFGIADFDAELARVNAERGSRNLPPLPAPGTLPDLADPAGAGQP